MPVELFCLTADSLSPAHGIERAAVPTKRLHVTGITLGLGCYAAADIGVTGGQQSFKRIRDTHRKPNSLTGRKPPKPYENSFSARKLKAKQ